MNKVLCDQCGNDLTSTSNSEDWSITLNNRRIPPWYIEAGERGGAVTDMMIYPQLQKDMDFCGLHCLRKWINTSETQSKPTQE